MATRIAVIIAAIFGQLGACSDENPTTTNQSTTSTICRYDPTTDACTISECQVVTSGWRVGVAVVGDEGCAAERVPAENFKWCVWHNNDSIIGADDSVTLYFRYREDGVEYNYFNISFFGSQNGQVAPTADCQLANEWTACNDTTVEVPEGCAICPNFYTLTDENDAP